MKSYSLSFSNKDVFDFLRLNFKPKKYLFRK